MAAPRTSRAGGCTIDFDPEIERIFHELADLDPAQRGEYFAKHAVSNEFRQEIESLLDADRTSTYSLRDVIQHQVGDALNDAGEATPGDQYGPYRLIRQIGSGGMAEVWLAERVDGLLKRQVALKLPHAGIQAWDFARRFNRERDILASLAHRGIARLYDAGVAEGGRPFLVLEFIEGVAFDRYSDERQLPIRTRLSLFLQVLDAVQYAHSHLVIHSDLKPSNILVSGDGEVKLLDFGIAKIMKSGETSGPDLTLPGVAAMTPGYAAPEQMAGQRVTTACDLYSLGIILFELLSGTRPFSSKRNSSGLLEQSFLIGRPSQAAIDEAKTRDRTSTPKRLAAALRGDLDNITLKAIQEKPENRYPTVDAFKSDLERYLAGQPVLARPESAWYRARKFVGRHKLPVAAAASVVFALAVGFSVALWESHVAKREAQTSAVVQEFIQNIFETNSSDQLDPVKARQTSARQLLDIGVRKIDSSLNSAPMAKERMLSILSNLYLDLGLDDQAVALAKKRVNVAKQVFGASDPKTAKALTALATTLHSSSSVNEREAVLFEAKRILDVNRDWSSPRRAALDSALAEHYQSSNRKKGLEFGADAVAIYRKLPPSDDFAGALSYEALIYSFNDEDAKAEPLFAEAVSVARKLSGSPDFNLPLYASNLGEANEDLMHYRAAEENLQFAWQSALRLNGEENVNTIETESRLGYFLGSVSRYHEALEHLGHATNVCLKIKGPNDPFYTPQMFLQYGETLAFSGQQDKGLSYISRAIQNRRRNRPGTRYLAQMLDSQALLLSNLGENEAAQQSLNEATAISRAVGFNRGKDFLAAQIILALNSNNPAAAMALVESGFGPLHPNDALTKDLLKNLYWRSDLALLNNDPLTAAALATRGLNLVKSSGSREYLKTWEGRYSLLQGNAYLLTRDPARALPVLQHAMQLQTEIYDPASLDIAVGEAALASCYLDLGNRIKSAQLSAQAEAIRRMHKRIAERYERPFRVLRERLARTHG